ncbi:hypothetical protein BGZ49_002124 [Haplosporangium sp. Z 27]|nr:hypothetical protein BGZ49_002124 [Haplosporangium sp. Z 27]
MMLGLPGPGFEFSERDCLNLNVFAPRLSQNMPVICYIHGGLSSGGNALPKNDATNIVKKSMAKNMPVVVVIINYRLLPSAGLLESSNNNDVKNKDGETFDWGIYDQKLALEWVKKHIHNFGGNPDEITLMGHSNGMSSPGYHLMNAKKEGLVKRAIMHSESKSRKSENEGDAARWSSKSFSETTELALARSARGNGTNIQFSFMSDTCMPYMSEAEKESGFRVIDRWIDFAWGKESSTGSNYNS